jgi:hypothetical protein
MRTAISHYGALGGRGSGAWGRHYDSDAYQNNTTVRRLRLADKPTATDPITLVEFVRSCSPDGTPEFNAWLTRAARKLLR